MSRKRDRLKTPVLLVGYRRPRDTSSVVEAVLEAKPERVFVATDGPRADVSTDAADCARVQEVLRTAEWPGRVHYLTQEENLGPRQMVPMAIEWAIEDAEQLIILEDDCVPDRTFFRFCENLLHRYQRESQVMAVSGTNPAPWGGRGPSYRFSTYGSVWGWATWASAWRHFWRARELLSDPDSDLDALAENTWRDSTEQDFWATIYRGLRDGGRAWSDTGWDYEWILARAMNQGLAAMPRVNLITNIGFGKGASDTLTGYAHPIGRMRRRRMRFPLVPPDRVEPDERVDAVLRSGHLEIKVPGLRGSVRGFLARVRGKVDATLKRNEFSH
jgi:hypothetical protein